MDTDVAQILAALKAEESAAKHRGALLIEVEALWAKDAKFRSAIRSIVKHSEIEDKRGAKSRVDATLAETALRLLGKLGFTNEEILDLLAKDVEPDSIKKLLIRRRAQKSQGT